MERTRREFIDQLRSKKELWEQLAGNGTHRETKDWLLQKTAEVVLMGDEIARLGNKINELTVIKHRMVTQAIDEHELGEEIRATHRKIEDKTLQMKSLGNQMDGILNQIYQIVGAKLGDLRKILDLETPKAETPEGYG